MGLQKYFDDFNKTIKMDYDELSELASKRDIIINKLRGNEDLPSFNEFNQGSYAMYTGVEPLDKEYDIDVGLRFNVNKDDYDPIELKQMVHDILEDHTDYGAEIQKPCVTVKYKKAGELAYHVDLPVYAYLDKNDTNSQLYLARGTNSDNQEWEEADPLKLIDDITEKHSDTEHREQYRRIIRYMKRWKNLKFSSSGNAEPPGIGITLLAYEKFTPQEYDFLEGKFVKNDLKALIEFVQNVKNMFVLAEYSVEKEEWLYKIEYYLPEKPNTNVFCKMSKIYMTDFKKKIEKLYNDLIAVKDESDIVEQCEKLKKIFGDDFPVPEKEKVSRTQSNSIPPSSASGRTR